VTTLFGELRAARDELQGKVRAAIEQGDDGGLNSLLDDFQRTWQAKGAELEGSRGSAEVVCGRIEPGIAEGRPQFERVLVQIQALELPEGLAERRDAAAAAVQEALGAMDAVEAMCAAPDDVTARDLLPAGNDLREKVEHAIAVLEALKSMKSGAAVFFEAEDEVSYYITTPGAAWDPREEIDTPWRSGYSGRGLWYMSRGRNWLDYEFDVPVTGEYVFWIRDFNDRYHPPQARVMTFEIDGREIGRFGSNSEPPGARGVFAWHKATTVALTQGSHTMKVIKERTTRAGGLMDAYFFGPPGVMPPEPGEGGS